MQLPFDDTLLDQYVLNGGILMAPLILCSLLAVGYTLQGLFRLRRRRVMPAVLLTQARQVSSTAARRAFILSLRGNDSPLGRAVWFALKDFAAQDRAPDPAEVDALIEEAAARAADEMYDGVGPLATIYTIAPLLGLLGTILGMIQTFYEFGVRGEKSLAALSIGIQEALITTLWGLGIAIPTYLAVQWLEGRIRRYERHALPIAAREVIVSLSAFAPEPPATPTQAPSRASTSLDVLAPDPPAAAADAPAAARSAGAENRA
jgi:biopolymer transport protein ExbB